MSVDTALHTAASWGLAPATPVDTDAADIGLPQAIDLGQAAAENRLLGLVDQAAAEGGIRCDPDAARFLRDKALGAASWELVAERHLLTVHELLDTAGVPHRFLKGAGVAHRFYEHPGLRMFVDIDVLVPPTRLDDAVAALEAAGHERDQPDPYPGFSAKWAKSVAVVHQDSQVEVDIHRVIADGPFGLRASADVLWDRPPAEVAIGTTNVPVLDAVAAFVHACVNAIASYDRVSLGSLRDVAELSRFVTDRTAEVDELARQLGVRACVTHAVRRVQADLAWTAPPEVAELADWPVSDLEQAWLDGYRGTSDPRRAWLALRAVPSLGGKASYAASTARLLAGRRARRRALEECDPCRKQRIQ